MVPWCDCGTSAAAVGTRVAICRAKALAWRARWLDADAPTPVLDDDAARRGAGAEANGGGGGAVKDAKTWAEEMEAADGTGEGSGARTAAAIVAADGAASNSAGAALFLDGTSRGGSRAEAVRETAASVIAAWPMGRITHVLRPNEKRRLHIASSSALRFKRSRLVG